MLLGAWNILTILPALHNVNGELILVRQEKVDRPPSYNLSTQHDKAGTSS